MSSKPSAFLIASTTRLGKTLRINSSSVISVAGFGPFFGLGVSAMPAKTKSIDLPTLIERFHNEDACRTLLEQLRWPNGIACSRCGSLTISRIHKRNQFDCDSCRYQFSVTSGTVLQDSKLPLWKWFLATYIICESKKGVSANQLSRVLGTTYRTSWHLSHRIRHAMGEVQQESLSGTVEVDETWVGGKPRHRQGEMPRDQHGRILRDPIERQTIVLGAIERGGQVRLQVARNRARPELHAFINRHIVDAAEAIYTDDWKPYRGIADKDTRHETVNHSRREYVRGNVHTNTIENVWSLMHRSIVGSYHKLSVKHLPAYLDEIEFRFNNRANPYLFRDTLTALLSAKALQYKVLTAE